MLWISTFSKRRKMHFIEKSHISSDNTFRSRKKKRSVLFQRRRKIFRWKCPEMKILNCKTKLSAEFQANFNYIVLLHCRYLIFMTKAKSVKSIQLEFTYVSFQMWQKSGFMNSADNRSGKFSINIIDNRNEKKLINNPLFIVVFINFILMIGIYITYKS